MHSLRAKFAPIATRLMNRRAHQHRHHHQRSAPQVAVFSLCHRQQPGAELSENTNTKWRPQQRRFQQTAPSATNQKVVTPFLLPDIGEGIKEVVIKQWLVKPGDHVQEFDPICEVESDKATATISSRFDGAIQRLHYEPGDMAAVGQPLVHIELNSSSQSSASSESTSGSTSTPPSGSRNSSATTSRLPSAAQASGENNVATLPSVRRLAREHGIDLERVPASGRNGRLLKEDLLSYLAAGSQSDGHLEKPGRGQTSTPTASASTTPDSERVRFSSIQRAMFKTMTQSLQIPHFHYADEIDMTTLFELFERRKKENTTGTPGSFAFFVKMVSLALREYPQLNASIDTKDNEHLVHKRHHNIGVAVDTPHGLMVPNIKAVESLSVEQIQAELLRLRALAYESKLTSADLSGGTLTLSNIGAVGGTFGVPVIVAPEILIGALGQARTLPRYPPGSRLDGSPVARRVMQVVWSADHRVVDGATLSRFSNLLKQLLEQPEMALTRLR